MDSGKDKDNNLTPDTITPVEYAAAIDKLREFLAIPPDIATNRDELVTLANNIAGNIAVVIQAGGRIQETPYELRRAIMEPDPDNPADTLFCTFTPNAKELNLVNIIVLRDGRFFKSAFLPRTRQTRAEFCYASDLETGTEFRAFDEPPYTVQLPDTVHKALPNTRSNYVGLVQELTDKLLRVIPSPEKSNFNFTYPTSEEN